MRSPARLAPPRGPRPGWTPLALLLLALLALPRVVLGHELKLDPNHLLVDPFDDNIIRTARLFNRAVVGVEYARNGSLNDVVLRAQGDIAFLDGRLGAGLDLPLVQHTSGTIGGGFGEQPFNATGFGQVRLRAAGQALRHRGTLLTLLTVAMRVTFPTSTQGQGGGIVASERYLIEPALLLSLTWRRLTFTTNQGAATAPARNANIITSYASSYALSYGILRWLGASAALDLSVPVGAEGASTAAYVTPAVSFFLPWNIHAGLGVRIGVAGPVLIGGVPDVAVMVRGGLEWDSFGPRRRPQPAPAPVEPAPTTPAPVTPPLAPTPAPRTPTPAPTPAPVPGDEVPGQGPPPAGSEPPPPTPPPIDEPDKPAPPPPPPPPPI